MGAFMETDTDSRTATEMKMLKIEMEIQRPNHHYEILFEPGLGTNWRSEVEERTHAESYLALIDRNLAMVNGWPADGSSDGRWNYLWVEPGEQRKNLEQYRELCEKATDFDIDRGTVLVAIGGGVTGDIAGFIAATLLRGIRLVQIPTSLLAQVDSSVGGKNGVNTPAGKNLVGTFKQPELVLIDPVFLETLPQRELLAGMAEIVKTAILDGPEFFQQLQHSVDLMTTMNHGFMAGAIARCCRFKTEVVVSDELEKGRRQLLNLGHTFGHALEALAGYDGRVVHGEAVSVGLVLAATFAVKKGFMAPSGLDEITSLLRALQLPVRIRNLGVSGDNPANWDQLLYSEELIAALQGDKKIDKGKLTLVLPHTIGDCRVEKGYTVREVADFMREEMND